MTNKTAVKFKIKGSNKQARDKVMKLIVDALLSYKAIDNPIVEVIDFAKEKEIVLVLAV